jgi:hypothetical protein
MLKLQNHVLLSLTLLAVGAPGCAAEEDPASNSYAATEQPAPEDPWPGSLNEEAMLEKGLLAMSNELGIDAPDGSPNLGEYREDLRKPYHSYGFTLTTDAFVRLTLVSDGAFPIGKLYAAPADALDEADYVFLGWTANHTLPMSRNLEPGSYLVQTYSQVPGGAGPYALYAYCDGAGCPAPPEATP